jgi:hypothetical protein
MRDLSLSSVDCDGALEESIARVLGGTRANLLRGVAIGAAAIGAGLAFAGSSQAAPVSSDIDILNYALVLEYLQASFYSEAEGSGALSGKSAHAANHLGAVERAHVKAIQAVLGSAAVKRPSFDFQGTTENQSSFLKTAVAFEDLAVAAYKGQATLISNPSVLAAAISIHSVEARHAGWMRFLFGIVPAASAFDDAFTKAKVSGIVDSTHFITSQPITVAAGKGRFTG